MTKKSLLGCATVSTRLATNWSDVIALVSSVADSASLELSDGIKAKNIPYTLYREFEFPVMEVAAPPKFSPFPVTQVSSYIFYILHM